MPSQQEILAGLGAIANDRLEVALLWHVALAAALLGLLRGWRPSIRSARLGLALLPLSVGAWAFLYGNPFNGIAFGLLTMLLVASAVGATAESAGAESSAAFWMGLASIAFGWIYPHFLVSRPMLAYIVAAPTGLIPCPTLAALVGFTLIGRKMFSRFWVLAVGGYGLFYAVFGVLRLGVWLDMGLFAGAAYLTMVAGPPQWGRPATASR